MATYTPAQAAKVLQMAASSIRNHCSNSLFQPFFSASATPPAGQARQLTDQDLRVLRFIGQATNSGATLQAVADRLAAGELQAFDWQPAAEEEPAAPASAALVLAQALRSELEQYRQVEMERNAAMIEAARELARAQATIDALTAEVARLEALLADKAELARLRAELERRQGFFARLFGAR